MSGFHIDYRPDLLAPHCEIGEVSFSYEQINAVVAWMEEWEILKNSVIPIRFREKWTDGDESIKTQNVNSQSFGLKSKREHDQHRQDEIMLAINQCLKADKQPPKEWLIEFMSYNKSGCNR